MIQRIASKLQRSINQITGYDLKTATGMTKWASDLNVSFNEACARADQFGKFLIHYENMNEAKTALTEYAECISRATFLPRWMRRDILFNASKHFMEPDFECFADEVYGDYEDDELFDQMMAYHATDAETRVEMRADFAPEILELLDGYYQRAEHYQQNKQFIMELKEIENMIECKKYGI